VEKFHDSFGISNNSFPTEKLEDGQIELRHLLMKEENDEYLEAAKNNDSLEIADALGDKLYLLCGTILKHGKPIYREDGKVLKGENYFRPDIKSIINR
jgi:hypothetical protein